MPRSQPSTARPAAPQDPSAQRLRSSPNFVAARTFDGRPYVAKDVEPYVQYWLSDRERLLLALFGGRHGATVQQAVDGYARLRGQPTSPAERKRLHTTIAGMREAGVLEAEGEDTSRYSARMAADYLRFRPFPATLTADIVAWSGIGPDSAVLDLAGGPGDLAVQLAHTSRQVSLMELSKGFLSAARALARRQGVPLATLHDSCNRLVQRDDRFDLITVAQALHWLDDVQVCRGVCRALKPGGSFIVVVGSMSVPDLHPLAHVLGDRSILGHKQAIPFADQVQALQRRLTLLFEALDAPDVHRIDPTQDWQGDAGAAGGSSPAASTPASGQASGSGSGSPATATRRIAPAAARLYRQQRTFGLGFARAFLTPAHIAITGQSPEAFWTDLQARCAGASVKQLAGHADWAVLQFRRGGAGTGRVPGLGDKAKRFTDDLPLD